MFRAHFFARSGRFALDPRPPDSMLEAETRGFSMFFDACTQPLCTLSEINKTLRWRTKIEVQAFRARIEKRRKINAIAVRAHECVQRGVRDGPRRCLERPGLPIWRPSGQHGAQDGQLGVRNGPTWRPELALSASRHVSGASQSAQRRPKPIFHGFQSIFRSFFDDSSLDFLSISARAACDEGTKADSLKEVA